MYRPFTSPPAEQLLDIGDFEFHVGRAPVAALAGMRSCFHLAQQGVHFGPVEAPSGTDAAVAGHGGADIREPVLERNGLSQSPPESPARSRMSPWTSTSPSSAGVSRTGLWHRGRRIRRPAPIRRVPPPRAPMTRSAAASSKLDDFRNQQALAGIPRWRQRALN